MMDKAIKKAVKSVGGSWPYLELDDLEQDVWVFLLERPNVMAELEGPISSGERHVKLVKIAHQIAVETVQKDELASGFNYYSTKDVRNLLERRYKSGDAISDLAEAMQWLIEYKPNQAEIIQRRYGHGETGLSDIERKHLQRGVDNLTNEMNRIYRGIGHGEKVEHVGPGARKAISNAKADYLTRADRDGSNNIERQQVVANRANYGG